VADTLTPNYSWVKPEVGASAATWGAKQNGVFDQIDAQVFANQQASVPVGSGALWFTATPPANWLLANGASLNTTTYAKLFAVYGYAFGGSGANFNLPNLTNRFPMGAGTLAATGGEATHVLTAAEIPAHAHTASQAAHGHAATQAAHAHAIATGSHAHTISTGSHSHGLDHTPITLNAGGNAGAAAGWGGNTTRTDTAGDLGGSTNTVGNLGGNTDAQQPAITVPTAQPAITVNANTGGGAAHNNLPPYLSINFIVRYQ
jgi:microcystin-dependent protein